VCGRECRCRNPKLISSWRLRDELWTLWLVRRRGVGWGICVGGDGKLFRRGVSWGLLISFVEDGDTSLAEDRFWDSVKMMVDGAGGWRYHSRNSANIPSTVLISPRRQPWFRDSHTCLLVLLSVLLQVLRRYLTLPYNLARGDSMSECHDICCAAGDAEVATMAFCVCWSVGRGTFRFLWPSAWYGSLLWVYHNLTAVGNRTISVEFAEDLSWAIYPKRRGVHTISRKQSWGRWRDVITLGENIPSFGIRWVSSIHEFLGAQQSTSVLPAKHSRDLTHRSADDFQVERRRVIWGESCGEAGFFTRLPTYGWTA